MPENMSADNCFKYNYALVSRIASSFKDTSSFDLKDGEEIDIENARHEHEQMVKVLRHLSLTVIELPCDEKYPDGLFVDDMAVVINGTAMICNPPTIDKRPTRIGEIPVVRLVLNRELGLKIVEKAKDECLVEGGDVLWTGREIFVGISKRTNMMGAQYVAKTFPEYPTTVVKVYPPAIHLKDHITMAGPEVMAVAKCEGAQRTFQEMRRCGAPGYKFITVDEDEAANVIYCNKTLIHLDPDQIPKGAAVFENKIEYPKVALKMVEPLKRGRPMGSCVLLIKKDKHPKKIPNSQE